MARTLLDYCISEPAKILPKQEAKVQAAPSLGAPKAEEARRERKPRSFPPVAPKNLPASYFVSASYDGRLKKAVIKLYEPESEQIYFWYDNTGHKPYCLTNLTQDKLGKFNRIVNHEGFYGFENLKKFDPLENRFVDLVKIVTKDPLAIGGRPAGTRHRARQSRPDQHPDYGGGRQRRNRPGTGD